MKSTYYSQCKAINKGTDITTLAAEWPFLFQEKGMMIHFEQLTGLALKDTFLQSLDKKGKRLLHFMRAVCAEKKKRILQAVTQLAVMRGSHEDLSEDIKDMVLLLLSYFDEKENYLFHYAEQTCLAEDVLTDNLSVIPCIVVCGKLKIKHNP